MHRLLFLLVLAVANGTPAIANPQASAVPGARISAAMETPFELQADGIPWAHHIMVALPPTYAAAQDRRYPVLYVLDGQFMMRAATGIIDILTLGNIVPEMIVVGVGSDPAKGFAANGRRIPDFSPPGEGYWPDGLGGERINELAPLPDFPHLAPEFLAFLTGKMRDEIDRRYRTDGRNTLYGHSAGGLFGGYALFAQPDAFDHIILGSPAVDNVSGAIWAQEERFADTADDLDFDLFIGAGDAETSEYFLAAGGIVEGAARLSRQLTLRRYPSLKLKTRFYPGENHYTVVPDILTDALTWIWKDESEKLGSSWPQPPEAPESD